MALYICSPNYWTVIWTYVMGKWTGDWLPQICIKSHCAGVQNKKETGAISNAFHNLWHAQTLVRTSPLLPQHTRKFTRAEETTEGFIIRGPPFYTRAHVLMFPDTLDHPALASFSQTGFKCCSFLQKGMFADTSHQKVLDCNNQIFVFCHGDGWYSPPPRRMISSLRVSQKMLSLSVCFFSFFMRAGCSLSCFLFLWRCDGW